MLGSSRAESNDSVTDVFYFILLFLLFNINDTNLKVHSVVVYVASVLLFL